VGVGESQKKGDNVETNRHERGDEKGNNWAPTTSPPKKKKWEQLNWRGRGRDKKNASEKTRNWGSEVLLPTKIVHEKKKEHLTKRISRKT